MHTNLIDGKSNLWMNESDFKSSNMKNMFADLSIGSSKNNSTNSDKCSSILEIKTNPQKELFSKLVEKFLFSQKGDYTSEVGISLSELNNSSTEKLLVLNRLGITKMLLHIESDLKALGIDPNKAIKIVGSSVFWILGKEYFIQSFKQVGIHLHDFFTDEELDDILKKPADIDIRIYLKQPKSAKNSPQITPEDIKVLKTIGDKISDFYRNDKNELQDVNIKYGKEGKSHIVDHLNCFLPFKIAREDDMADILFVNSLFSESVTVAEDCFLPLSMDALKVLDGTNSDTKAMPLIPIIPDGLVDKGWAALLMRLTYRTVMSVEAFNHSAAIKYLVLQTHGKFPISENTQKKLLDVVFKSLCENVSIKTMCELHHAIASHFLQNGAAHVAVLFNIFGMILDNDLLDHFFGQQRHRYDQYQKLLAKFVEPPVMVPEIVTEEMRSSVMTVLKNRMFNLPEVFENEPLEQAKGIQSINDPTTPDYAKALYRLMKGEELPYNVLVAYLLLQSHLLESRKEFMGQKLGINAVADQIAQEHLTQLMFKGEGISLLLRKDFYSEMNVLCDYFASQHLSPETLTDLRILSDVFHHGVEENYPLTFKEVNCSAEVESKLENLIKASLHVMDKNCIQFPAFLLICQCCQDLGRLRNLDRLIPAMFDLIQKSNSVDSVIILRQFLQLLERCHPRDGIFQQRNKIEELIKIFAASSSDNEAKITAFLNLLAYSHISDVAEFVIDKAFTQPSETPAQNNQKMITGYLKLTPPAFSLALKVIEKSLATNSAKDLMPLIQPIYKALKNSSQPQHLQPAINITQKLINKSQGSKWTPEESTVFTDFLDYLFDTEFSVMATGLFIDAEKAGMNTKCTEISLKILLSQFQDKKISYKNLATTWNGFVDYNAVKSTIKKS